MIRAMSESLARRHGATARAVVTPPSSLRRRRDAGRFAVGEELELDDVRIAAHGAVLDVALLHPAGRVERDDDPLAAGRADVGAFVARPASLLLSLGFLHVGIIVRVRRGRSETPAVSAIRRWLGLAGGVDCPPHAGRWPARGRTNLTDGAREGTLTPVMRFPSRCPAKGEAWRSST